MGDRDDYKSKKYYDKSRRRKRDDDDDDDDEKHRYRDHDSYASKAPKKSMIERVLTPGQTANNIIKTTASGIIAGSTVLLMMIYGVAGENIAGAESYLPMATIVTSALATASVWMFGRPKTEETDNAEFAAIKKELNKLNKELTQLGAENDELEQRLATVEMLESFEDKLAKRTLDKQLESEVAPPPLSSDLPVHSETSSSSPASNSQVTQ